MNPKWIAAGTSSVFWVDAIDAPLRARAGRVGGASPLTKLLKMPRLLKALRVLKMTKLTRACCSTRSASGDAPPCASQRRDRVEIASVSGALSHQS